MRRKGGSHIRFTRGVPPLKAYTVRPRPKRVPFSGFRYMKEHGFHSLKYMKEAGNLPFRSVKSPTGLRDILYKCKKSRENVLVLWFLHIFKTLHFLVKRYAKLVCERGTICQWKIFKMGAFSFKTGILKGTELDLGAKPLRIILCRVSTPGSFICPWFMALIHFQVILLTRGSFKPRRNLWW